MQLQGSPVDFCHELRHVIIGIINRTLERMYKTSEAYYFTKQNFNTLLQSA